MTRFPNSKGLLSLAFVLASSIIPISEAHAGAFALREHTPVGESLSFAGAAAGAAGLGSVYFNPATMTQFYGIQGSFALTGIAPVGQHTNQSGTSAGYDAMAAGFGGSQKSGDFGQDAVVPATHATYQLNDKLWLGMSVTSPYGLSTKMDENYVGRLYGATSTVRSLEASGLMAYRLNDVVSFGGGLRVMQFKARNTSAIPASTPPSQWSVLGLQGDSVGVGYSAGLTLTPVAGTDIGLGYRSKVQQDLKGDFFGAPLAALNQPIRMSLPLPQSLMVSLRQQIDSRWTVMASYEWTDWSKIGSPAVIQQASGQPHPLQPAMPLNYKDNWFTSLGAEYRYDPQWTLRGGVSFESGPLKNTTRGIRLPDNDRFWASFGAGYRLSEALTLDLAYLHVFPMPAKVRIDANNINYNATLAGSGFGTLYTKIDSRIDIVSLALTYRFDQPQTSAALPGKR